AEVLFLPAYSPDLNPIEKMWSKIKQSLRSTQARTQRDILRAIASAFESVSSRDAMNWFASCGYRFIKNFLMYSDPALEGTTCKIPPLFIFSKSPEFNISPTSSLV